MDGTLASYHLVYECDDHYLTQVAIAVTSACRQRRRKNGLFQLSVHSVGYWWLSEKAER